MELIINNNPLWTNKHLEHWKKYADSYGGFCEKNYELELKNITDRNASSRCKTDQSCYEIHVGHNHVGDIVMNSENEIDILIFDEFSGKKYASQALSKFIKEYHNQKLPLEAVIRGGNENKDRIQKVLRNAGFKLVEACADGTEIWINWINN